MSRLIVFVRRQSPDWSALATDYRAGRLIDPARYVPPEAIFGFPERVDRLIERWNVTFKFDFFSFRAAIAKMSRLSVDAVAGSVRFDLTELPKVADLARRRDYFVYFHDDDDFFSPSLAAPLQEIEDSTDAVVTPLFRVWCPILTFIRTGHVSDAIWGKSEPPSFRFQTNNYGVNSRRADSDDALWALKDHVQASAYADEQKFVDRVLTTPVSATVKTPASASVLPSLFDGDRLRGDVFSSVTSEIRSTPAPPNCEWATEPAQLIANLIDEVMDGLITT